MGISPASARQTTESPLYLPLVMNGFDGTWHWQKPEMLTLTPRPNIINPQFLVVKDDGQVHLLWDTIIGDRFIYQTYQTSQGWSPVGPIAETLGSSYTIYAPVLDQSGQLHLLWRNWLGSGIEKPYRLMYARFDGAQWQETEIYRTTNSYVQGMVHLNADGSPAITYVDSMFAVSPAYQTRLIPGGWLAPVEIAPTFSSSLTWPDMQGGVHFYSQNSAEHYLYYSYWLNGGFVIKDRVIDGNISSRETQLDGQSNLHLYWVGQVPVPGGQVRGIHRQCLDNSSLVFTPEEYLTGEDEVDGTPRAASDGISQIVLGWKQAGTDRLWLVVWEGCQETERISISIPEVPYWNLLAVGINQKHKVCALVQKPATDQFALLCAEY